MNTHHSISPWRRIALSAGLTAVILLVAPPALAGAPWVSQTGLSETQLNDRLTHWSAPPLQLPPACISGYVENGQTRYAALWVKPPDSDPRRALVGRTAAALLSWDAFLQSTGWRLVWINGFTADGEDYYNAIYRLTGGVAQTLRVGDSLADHQAADAQLSASGYYLDNVCAFRSGLRYAAWWNRSPSGIVPQSHTSYGLSATEYQAEFNARSGSWRLVNVCGYRAAFPAEDRFTTVWRRPAPSDGWSSIHAMTKTNYFAAQDNQVMTGWRPSFQQIWTSGSEVRVNAIWVQDGGLALSRLSAFDETVRGHMTANDIPGLTLAITRGGRLVFARAWGLADVEAGEWAGPDHRFRVASVSKPICAVGVLHALEAHPAHLDTTLFGSGGVFGNDYGTAPYSAREQDITVRHLLHHNAGWLDDGHLWWHDDPSWEMDHSKVIDYQLDTATTFVASPGITGRYSNLGYTIAARVPEKLSGQSYRDYMRGTVLAECGIGGALGMDIGGRARSEQKFMEAAYYPYAGNDAGPYAIHPGRMDGSTAWIARPSDMLLFARRCDGLGPQEDILSLSSMAAMRLRSSTTTTSSGYSHSVYGLGWYTDNYANPTRWGHNGSMNGTRAELVVRLDGYSYAWMANTQAGIPNSDVDAFINATHAANAWPDIDLSNSVHPGYDAWMNANFSALDRGQPGLREAIWGPSADPDGDHIPNAGEAYLGLDPQAADASPFSVARQGNNLRMRWLRVVGPQTGVHPLVQTSTNLVTWSYPVGVPITDRPDLITIAGKMWQEVLLPMTSSRRFLRLEFATH